ncbi:MAG: hypothetical protein WCF16_09240, partial [Alphaproteobacteria bacterium]
ITTAACVGLVGIPATTIWKSLLRPVGAALMMCAVVALVQIVSPAYPVVRLGLSVGAGAFTFIATLLGLWHFAGRPATLEHDLLNVVLKWIRRGPAPAARGDA